jgi:hypothetical protein
VNRETTTGEEMTTTLPSIQEAETQYFSKCLKSIESRMLETVVEDIGSRLTLGIISIDFRRYTHCLDRKSANKTREE